MADDVGPITQWDNAAQRRQARVLERRSDPRVGQGPPQLRTILEEDDVMAPTRVKYRQAIREMNAWLAASGCVTVDPFNRIVNNHAAWMQAMLLIGYLAEKGSLTITAVKFEGPEFGHRGALALPRADLAIRGKRRRAPLASRPPLPWEVVALIVADLIEYGELWMGYPTVLSSRCYFRPSKPLKVGGRCLIPPLDFGGRLYWSIRLHPIDFMISNKSSVFDETLVIVKEPFLSLLGPEVHRLKMWRGADEKVFSFTQAQWNAAFLKAALRVGVADLKPYLYGLRHGGASCDRATHAHPDLEVKLRGRWTPDASVQRCEKHGHIAEQLHQLGAEVMAKEMCAPARLGRLLARP
jgi:hypothetical protein